MLRCESNCWQEVRGGDGLGKRFVKDGADDLDELQLEEGEMEEWVLIQDLVNSCVSESLE